MTRRYKYRLFGLILFTYLFCASGLPWIEADIQLRYARTVIQQHRFSQDSPGDMGGFQGRGGKYYDWHGLLNVAVMMPFAALGILLSNILHSSVAAQQISSFLGALTGVVVNAAACLIFFEIMVLLGRPRAVSCGVTLCLAFLTIVFPYASKNYEGNLLMLFMLVALYCFFSYCRGRRIWHLVCCGINAGLLINTKEFAWLFIPYLFLFIFAVTFRERKIQRFFIFLACFLPLFLVWGFYNWLRTGVFFMSPIVRVTANGDLARFHATVNPLFTLGRLLFGKGSSLFIYSPVLLLSLLGWKRFLRERKQEGSFILLVIITFLAANASIGSWFGFFGWGPRYTLEITPLLMLPLAWWLKGETLKDKNKRLVFFGVGALSLLIQVSAVFINWHARLSYLLEKGEDRVLDTVIYSQWWDALKVFATNLWNLFFGSYRYIETAGYHFGLSHASLLTAKTLSTWWNRLLMMGVSPVWVYLYVVGNLFLIVYFAQSLYTIIKDEAGPRKPAAAPALASE